MSILVCDACPLAVGEMLGPKVAKVDTHSGGSEKSENSKLLSIVPMNLTETHTERNAVMRASLAQVLSIPGPILKVSCSLQGLPCSVVQNSMEAPVPRCSSAPTGLTSNHPSFMRISGTSGTPGNCGPGPKRSRRSPTGLDRNAYLSRASSPNPISIRVSWSDAYCEFRMTNISARTSSDTPASTRSVKSVVAWVTIES